ncbi:hypothetical protein CFD26_107167 [Aspergillus turcosus]|uniref:G-protein coupled receptors family 2 profile 2 domain-containing protein n=1 Tax=Aspergillus turcosus TaxID=1245748 RepID=A0A421DA98_9EURO|nr:hypothetical protein CFD26_107167 [Aspergillus turcosus]
MSLTQRELFALSTTERICSTVSLIGTSVIVVSFLASSSFRKPINRLVFYASWGNIMANVATMISHSGIDYGTSSCLCQFQAFLIQWFMPADALWTLAMACNVYLTFFHKYDAEQLRQLEWKYLLFCYGLPFIPAFVYFFIETEARGRIYGSAILWCWVALPWDFLRIAVFYGPVWFVISLTFAIYLRAGRVIFQKRRQLAEAGCSDSSGDIDSPMDPAFPKKTEIHVTSEITHTGSEFDRLNRLIIASASYIPHRYLSPYSPYTVTIEGGSASGNNDNVPMQTLRRSQHDPYAQRRAAAKDVNSAAWAYTKYAILFFIALLVTWVPSTINRLYSLIYPSNFNFAMNYTSSFVLPLQGFWNSIIYVSISWPAFKAAFANIKLRNRNSLHRASLQDHNKKNRLEVKMAEETQSTHVNQPQQAASPSPPPPAPVPITPGPRASRLQQVFGQALARTLRANSYANFSGCFPTPAKHVPASLESVWRQLNAKLEESAKAEFDDIIHERDAVRHLNELDRLVGEARHRRDNGQGESRVAPHTLTPDELYRAHLTPYLQEAQSSLDARIRATESENAELAQHIQGQRAEIERLLSGLEAIVADVEGAAAAASHFSKENDLRQEAFKMDEEVKDRSEI